MVVDTATAELTTEAEAAMLGQPQTMLISELVGKLSSIKSD
jgi:hypothetical protein